MVNERIDPGKDKNIMKLSRLGHIKRYGKVISFINTKKTGNKKYLVLDAGCGFGYGSALLSMHMHVIGVDNSRIAINYARKNYKNNKIKYLVADLEKYNFNYLVKNTFNNSGKFNIITCFEVLEHLNNPGALLKKFRKCVASDGYLFLSLPNGRNAPENNPYHTKNYSQAEVELLLRKNNFEVQQVFGQYFLIGTLAGLAKKITGYESDTDKKTSFVPKMIDKIPVLAEIFSCIFPGKLAASTARTLYFIARPK